MLCVQSIRIILMFESAALLFESLSLPVNALRIVLSLSLFFSYFFLSLLSLSVAFFLSLATAVPLE